jgi:cytochrome c biogenesis protein CcmG, thiol:disulfide interchange protein DsbE
MTRALVLAALACAAACSAPARDVAFRPLRVGDTTPAYAVRTLAGDSVRVGAGSPVLLNVWATWCTSCREEMADLAALERAYATHGVRVLAVSVDAGDGTRVRRFADAERLPFAVAHDPAGVVQRSFQAVGVPETYLISGDGRLLWVQRGGLHGAPAAVRATLDSAVSAASAGT